MNNKLWKLELIFIAIFLKLCECTVMEFLDACDLRYRNPVDEKPDLFVSTEFDYLGICRIRHEAHSAFDYHVEKTSPTDDNPEISISSLHYNAQDDTIFYFARFSNSLAKLYKIRLNDTYWEVIFDQEDLRKLGWPFTSYLITNTAYDWATKNLYINFHKFLGVINMDTSWNISVILRNRKFISNIALHPNKGYLYFIDEASYANSFNDQSIYRAYLDGSNVIEFNCTKSNNHTITNIVVDLYDNKLYWSIPDMGVIQSSNLDGQDIKTINNVHIYYDALSSSSRTLAIDRHYVYYLSADSNSVCRLNKGNYLEDKDYELFNKDSSRIKEIMVFTYASQKVRDDHPCKNANGGCEKYCFAVPQKESLKQVCGCSFLEDIGQDDKSCVEGLK